MKTFWRLLAFAKPYRNFVPEYMVYAILAVIFGVFNFSLLIPLLNVLFGTVKLPEVLVTPNPELSAKYAIELFNYNMNLLIRDKGMEYALMFICGLIFLLIVLSNLFKYLAQRVLSRMRATLMQNLRTRIFNKYTNLSIGYLNDQRKGDLITLMSNDVQDIEFSILISLEVLFKEPLLIIGYFTFLFTISPHLTLFTILYLPLVGFLINRISKRLKSGDGLKYLSNLMSITEETLSGLRVIKIFHAEKFVQNRFLQENQAFRNYIKRWFNKREMASPTSEILGVLSAIGLILYGGHLVITKDTSLDASQFITYILIFSQILAPAKAIASSFATIQRGLAAGDRIFSVLDVESEIRESQNPTVLHQFSNEIRFSNVSFSHGTNKVLQNISFEIQKGKSIALVGPSGGGKSTIIDLLARFYDVNSGSITIDGINIKDLRISDLRHLTAMVNQETILFNDTIFNNIAFGKNNVTAEEVEEAARIANAHDFISASELGYNTPIGDRGAKLSGGQRQRISIARAVLHNPAILILDEATSALDTESESWFRMPFPN
jgi:subfamily B ATP-binding cassette protein MsbA